MNSTPNKKLNRKVTKLCKKYPEYGKCVDEFLSTYEEYQEYYAENVEVLFEEENDLRANFRYMTKDEYSDACHRIKEIQKELDACKTDMDAFMTRIKNVNAKMVEEKLLHMSERDRKIAEDFEVDFGDTEECDS